MPIDWRNEVSTCVKKKFNKIPLRTHQSLIRLIRNNATLLKIAVKVGSRVNEICISREYIKEEFLKVLCKEMGLE